ncbi:uncharacterized protein LOC121055749 [Oryza brachyantha]|uniref:Uncharacterized protein n=1 Tax=Oryza brachyantha TaxID=4533 RepID=J3N795_ORYBR|nr:uncharacterized protein LOC121055749 [Oryza brachyantha]
MAWSDLVWGAVLQQQSSLGKFINFDLVNSEKVLKMEGKTEGTSSTPPALAYIPRYDKDDEHRPAIICALTALPIPPAAAQTAAEASASAHAKWQRRTFWTECGSCREKKKLPISDMNSQLTCPACTETFTAVEVARPRSVAASPVAENSSQSSSAALVPASDVVVVPFNLNARAAREGGQLSRAFPKSEVDKLLKERMKEIIELKLKEGKKGDGNGQ